MTKVMNLGKRVIACDGTKYYFRRKAGNPAIAERVAMHVERGWLRYAQTVDDVEVYDVAAGAPFRVRQTSPSQQAFNQLLDDVTECAANERWADYFLAVRELAWWLKNAGQPQKAYTNLLQHCLQNAAIIAGNPLLPERATVEVRRIQRQKQPIIMVGPTTTQ